VVGLGVLDVLYARKIFELSFAMSGRRKLEMCDVEGGNGKVHSVGRVDAYHVSMFAYYLPHFVSHLPNLLLQLLI
jgi:hypothetical protein